jgi:hypothetical protein
VFIIVVFIFVVLIQRTYLDPESRCEVTLWIISGRCAVQFSAISLVIISGVIHGPQSLSVHHSPINKPWIINNFSIQKNESGPLIFSFPAWVFAWQVICFP